MPVLQKIGWWVNSQFYFKKGYPLKLLIFCISDKNQFFWCNDIWLTLNVDLSSENKWETFIDKKMEYFTHYILATSEFKMAAMRHITTYPVYVIISASMAFYMW